MLEGKTVLLGVTGSIAAYKIAYLASALKKQHADVHVLMTRNATNFINPITFETLTGNKCLVDTFDRNFQFQVEHVSIAKKADVVMIAPASANVIGKLAHGIADDMLTTTIMACRCKKFISPAMNTNMFENPIVQDNLKTLEHYGYEVIDPAVGYLACGEVGKGRLPDPELIVARVLEALDAPASTSEQQVLAGKRVMITAGPTVEAIDPVRYITNRSSGKFGYALAETAARKGAEVTLVSGPVALPAPEGVEVIYVESARDMLEAATPVFEACDVGIFAAAVADVRPAKEMDRKLKKGINDAELANIALVENPDVLATLGNAKTDQIVVGFAAETNDVIDNARKKLIKKNADMIVANEVGANKVFGKDDDEVWLVTSEEETHLPLMSKAELADIILDTIAAMER